MLSVLLDSTTGVPMGKPKARGSRVGRKRGGRSKARPAEESYSIEDLLSKASSLLEECQFEAAEKFCQRALEMDPDNVLALEMSANLLLERGEVEKAQHCLGRAITGGKLFQSTRIFRC